jgi:hypothetical protein
MTAELATEHERLRAELDRARRSWGELGETYLETGGSYADGEPVRVLVRKRNRRYLVTDAGRAVEKAGRPGGWYGVAAAVVATDYLNLNRRGAIFVPAVEGGADLASLAARVGRLAIAVYEALLELDRPRRAPVTRRARRARA